MIKKTAFLILSFAFSCSAALDVAQISLANDVDDVRYATRDLDFDRLEPIRFFRWESVTLDVTALHGETPAVLTDDDVFLRWEAYENEGDTNAAIHKVGTVVDASAGHGRITLTPAEAGLPAGEYYSYVRAFQPVGGVNVYLGVVAYNRLIVKWAPNPGSYTYDGPYNSDELTEVRAQILAVSNSVQTLEESYTATSNAFQILEGSITDSSDVWNSVTGKVDAVDGTASNLTFTGVQTFCDTASSGMSVVFTDKWAPNEAFGFVNELNGGDLRLCYATYNTNFSYWGSVSTLVSFQTTGHIFAPDATNADDSYLLNVGAMDDRYAAQSITNDVQTLETNLGTVSNSFLALETVVTNSSNVWNLAETAVQNSDTTYTQTVALASTAVQNGVTDQAIYIRPSLGGTIGLYGASADSARFGSFWGSATFSSAGVGLSDGGNSLPLIWSGAAPSSDTHIGNRGYNDGRYASTGDVITVSAKVAALETNILSAADGIWRASTDRAYVKMGTNTAWIYATASPTDEVYNAVSWSVTETNATFMIGTNTVEVRP